jgi:mono/diheme cytochrome c family protein
MSRMKHRLLVLFAAAVAVAAGRTLFAQDAVAQRGKYLVEEVGRCQECHTPKMESGEFDKSKWLKGAKLSVAPIEQIPRWHAQAPDITSTSILWQRWGDDGVVKFLETASNPRGGKADVPMPAYTLKHEDALAIVAYLKSLP